MLGTLDIESLHCKSVSHAPKAGTLKSTRIRVFDMGLTGLLVAAGPMPSSPRLASSTMLGCSVVGLHHIYVGESYVIIEGDAPAARLRTVFLLFAAHVLLHEVAVR